MTAILWAVLGLAAFTIGLGKGGLGGMVGALVTAMIALVLPANQVIGLVLPLLIVGDFFAIIVHWGRWDKSITLQIVPGAVLGVLLATYLLFQLSGEGLRIALGFIVLIFVILKLLEGWMIRQIVYGSKPYHGWLAGMISGITSTLAHGGGPPMSMYLVLQSLEPRTFAATAAFFFFILNWVKVPSYWAAGLFDWELLRSVMLIMPLIPIGVWTGKQLVQRIDRVYFEQLILVLLGVSGVFLVLR